MVCNEFYFRKICEVKSKMEKSTVFRVEMNYIKEETIRKSLAVMVEKLPDYFFHTAASSTGKYHPSYALGEGGLVRHTKAAVRVAYELLGNPAIGDKYTQREKDLMIMGLILHDGLKLGLPEEKYTRFDHPLLVGKFIEENKEDLFLTEEDISFLKEVISSHMGPWTTDYNGNEVLPKPKTKYQNFVHMCDFLASRKAILFQFDRDNNIIC